MKGTIKLIPVTEKLAEGKKVIYLDYITEFISYADAVSCFITDGKIKIIAEIKDLKNMVIEYHTLPIPEDRKYKRGYTLAKYNSEMSKYEASRRTISVNPNQWQIFMDLGRFNKICEFSIKNGYAIVELKKEKI